MNKIELKNMKPTPLRGLFDASEVWGTSLSFEKGKTYSINAPSGKGKSTFVHIIYGLRFDFEGTILLDGISSKEISTNEWANIRENNLAIVFQDLRLFLQLTALENIEIKNRLTQQKSISEIKKMADQLGIADLLGQRCEQLSYGQRQRVAIIRAICQPFDFLLLDEPFSHLDKVNISHAKKMLLEEQQANGAGMIITTLDSNFNENRLLKL